VVAVVTVAGTLGAAALTQFAGLRNKRLDAEIQYKARAEERAATASEVKLATYVELNNAARDYRAFGHDYLVDKLDAAEPENLDQIEELRAKYREVYGRAEMIVPDRLFKLVAEVNTCLGYSYRALHDLEQGSHRSIAGGAFHEWYDGPLVDGMRLLRRVLREDLGVAETNTDVDLAVRRLRQARLTLWPHETSSEANFQDDAL
jgi:phosphoglycolate phosphatase-like HAD superfamily hydrolase